MKSIVSAKKKPARRYLSNIWGDPNRPTTVNSCMPNRS